MANIINLSFFFFNDTATTEIYTLSLHDALPIFFQWQRKIFFSKIFNIHYLDTYLMIILSRWNNYEITNVRSEEHTSELQSRQYLVCRLLLEKKKTRHCNHLSFIHTIKSLSPIAS